MPARPEPGQSRGCWGAPSRSRGGASWGALASPAGVAAAAAGPLRSPARTPARKPAHIEQAAYPLRGPVPGGPGCSVAAAGGANPAGRVRARPAAIRRIPRAPTAGAGREHPTRSDGGCPNNNPNSARKGRRAASRGRRHRLWRRKPPPPKPTRVALPVGPIPEDKGTTCRCGRGGRGQRRVPEPALEARSPWTEHPALGRLSGGAEVKLLGGHRACA